MNEISSDTTDIIEDHLSDFFDENDEILLYDDFKSDIIQTDIYIVKATKDRPFHILLSCGMSSRPMDVPKGEESSPYGELMMLLPADWKIDEESFKDECNLWPIRLMINTMVDVHKADSYVGFGGVFGVAEDEEYAPGIGFNSALAAFSMELDKEFTQIKTDDGKAVDIYTLIPLYEEELTHLENNDAEDLLELFDIYGIGEIIKVGRKNIWKT